MDRRTFLGGAAAALAGAAEQPAAVRLGIIGSGGRGRSLMGPLLDFDDVAIKAIADLDDNALSQAQRLCLDAGRPKPDAYPRGERDYLRLLEREDLDAVVIATPWQWHAPMMLAAMDAGKAAASEVPVCVTLDECWALIEKQEKTGLSATMLENWVFRREPLAVLNIARAGLLGEIVHCESGYGHDVRAGKFDARQANRGELRWRGENSVRRNGNLYPTHQFAPVAMLMDINHGTKIDHLVAMAGPSMGMNQYAADLWGPHHPSARRRYANADRTTVLLQLNDGRTAVNFHDTQSWHPRDDGHKYHGTKGMVRWPYPGKGTAWLLDRHWDGKSLDAREWHPLDPLLEEFDHPLWRKHGERALQFGHNGADWLELRAWVESLRAGSPPPVPLVDAVTWAAIAPLSERSVAGRGERVEMPDFTRGRWRSNPRFEVGSDWA